MVEPDELEALRPKGSHAIEIEEFVDLDQIDPLYFEQPYYLVPDKRGVKPYKLLVDAMTDMNKVAIGRIVMRSQGAARRDPSARRHALHRDDALRRRSAARTTSCVPEDDVELTERERTMARQLVESLAVEGFEPEKYHDQYREQVLDLIERKAAGEEIVAEPRRRGAREGARPRRRAGGLAREGDDREGTAPERRGGRCAGQAGVREEGRQAACEEARPEDREGGGEEALGLTSATGLCSTSSQPQRPHTGVPSPAAKLAQGSNRLLTRSFVSVISMRRSMAEGCDTDRYQTWTERPSRHSRKTR